MEHIELKLRALNWLQEAMPGNHVEFSGPAANDMATALVTKQTQRWNAIFELLGSDPTWRHFVNILQDVVRRTGQPQLMEAGPVVIVEGSLPIITRDVSGEGAKNAQRFPELALAYVLTKCRPAIQPNSEEAFLSLVFSTSAAEVEILQWKNEELDDRGRLENALQTVGNLEKHSAAARQMIDGVVANADKLFASINESDQKRRADWDKEKADIITDLRREAQEAARIEASIDLWKDKAASHNFAFWIGAGLFGATLLGITVSVIFFATPFVRGIAESFSGEKQYFGIALLLIPTLAIAWVIRVIIKVTIQNLSLAQDARQRHTQILTYLRMLGDSNHPISQDERILALSAIFRPLAGQGSDDVNPPTVAELVREALERSLKPSGNR